MGNHDLKIARGSAALMCFNPGASGGQSPARRKISPGQQHASDWKRLSAGTGTKGPRLHDWCYLELADLEVEPFNGANQGLWTRGLLIRRHIADADLAFSPCPGSNIDGNAGRGRRPSMGDRG